VPAPADVQISTPNSPATTPEDQLPQVAATPAETHTNEQAQPTVETAPEPATGSSQTAKPKRGRKRTTAAVTVEDAGEQEPTASRKRPRKRAAPLPGEEGYQPATRRETRSRKRSASAVENEEPEEDGEENAGQNKKKPPRPQREATPPDAEAVEIDITQVKMADLAKDMHIGKKFSLHDELMERERAKRLRYNERRKRQQTGEEGDEIAEADEAPNATPSSDLNSSAQPTPAADDDSTAETPADSNARAPIGETYQIIDGEIVLDHRSLQVDRHARAREEAGDLVEIEENDFTHHTTSATYLRRNLKPQQWTDEETDLFYQALQAFGTDFDTICRMFRGKTRKHIKLKFNREERVNPQRITAALVGQKTVSFDMEQYQRATGQEYETAEAIYAEQKKAEEEFEARQKALEDEKAEEVRRKKEEVLAQLNSAVDGEGPKKGGRKGKKKKGPALMGL
jgi:transcription factor TFIIIB component B''